MDMFFWMFFQLMAIAIIGYADEHLLVFQMKYQTHLFDYDKIVLGYMETYDETWWFNVDSILTGAKSVELLDGLLGVAGMICSIGSQWIIPENSLLSTSKIFVT